MVADRPMRCSVCAAETVQPCNGEHQVGSPFGVDECVELVDDQRLAVSARTVHFGGQHEKQGLRVVIKMWGGCLIIL